MHPFTRGFHKQSFELYGARRAKAVSQLDECVSLRQIFRRSKFLAPFCIISVEADVGVRRRRISRELYKFGGFGLGRSKHKKVVDVCEQMGAFPFANRQVESHNSLCCGNGKTAFAAYCLEVVCIA